MADIDKILDKMVDHVIKFEEIEFLDLVQFVWRRAWELNSAQDSSDEDPLRYALKACLLERMAEIWSSPPKNIPTLAPIWCKDVPAVTRHFSVVDLSQAELWKDEPCSEVFEKRNIFAPKQFMFFL